MLITLNFILDTLGIRQVRRHYNAPKAVYYYSARWLGNTGSVLEPNCVYIGYASMLPPDFSDSEVGIMVLNDTGRDFSSCSCDFVELCENQDPAALCIQVKENIFRSFEISSISQQIIERFARVPTIKEIVDLTASMLENPVFINFHFSGRQFFHSPISQNENEARILSELKQHIPSAETMETVNALWDSPYASISDDGMVFHGKRRMHATISKGIHGGAKVGILTVFEVNRVFTSRDQSFVNFIAYLFSVRAGESGFEKQLFGYQYEQKLQELLNGEPVSRDTSWSDALFGNEYCYFSLALTNVKELTAQETENLKYLLLQSAHFAMVLMRGSYLLLIVNRKEEYQDQYVSLLRQAADKYHLTFGVSDDFSDIRKLKKYYTQAKGIREFLMDQKQQVRVCFFSQHRFQLLIHDLSAAESPELYSDDALERLMAYDSSKNTEYWKTLSIYIRRGMNKELARKELNIHRNTLSYRLDKIQEILGHSLNDGEFLMGLYVSNLIKQSLMEGPPTSS